jgi:hypothetical protein
MVQEKFVACGNRAGTLSHKEKMAAAMADSGTKIFYARSRVFIPAKPLSIDPLCILVGLFTCGARANKANQIQ